MVQEDIRRLIEMRRLAAALEGRSDPLLAGLVGQLLGTIDALFNIAGPPQPEAVAVRVQATR